MKAYKIRLDAYDSYSKDEKGEKIKRSICVKWELPHILCNPGLSKAADGKPDKNFDLLEIGPIAQKIEQCKDLFLEVSPQEWEILKKRIKQVSSLFGYANYEMFRRVMEAQPVDMIENKMEVIK